MTVKCDGWPLPAATHLGTQLASAENDSSSELCGPAVGARSDCTTDAQCNRRPREKAAPARRLLRDAGIADAGVLLDVTEADGCPRWRRKHDARRANAGVAGDPAADADGHWNGVQGDGDRQRHAVANGG